MPCTSPPSSARVSCSTATSSSPAIIPFPTSYSGRRSTGQSEVWMRVRKFRSTSGTRATRRTAARVTRGAFREFRRTRASARPRSTSPTSASRTRAGTSARWCS
uniref:(northern house mosquito) hypothetical protein n=1 Tax=Culex pipiens TaxID=7175 RepID=A0A8D8ANG8_CULPI